MRIDMTLVLKSGDDYKDHTTTTQGMNLRLTTDQARALRDQITKHLRGPSRDKEEPPPSPSRGPTEQKVASGGKG